MQDLDASGNQGVGDEAAVAAPGHGLGAEDHRWGVRGAAYQPFEGGAEFRGLHVVGVAAKGFDPPGGMLGVGAGGTAATKVRFVHVVDAGSGQGSRQGIA
jgi:hypothetical protein